MKGLASSTGLPSSSNFASRHQLCSGLVAILLAILLLELGLIHGPSIQVPSSKQPFSSGNAITNLPQGPDQQLWNMQAQQFFSVLEAALSRYFPAEMPFNDGRQNNNKQKYMKTHLPRFMHTLLRASPHIQQGASMIAIGEKGHVPALLYELFKPKMLKVTTTEFPGLLGLQDTLSNSTVQVELVHHNIETQPLPFKSESVDHVFFLEVLEHLEMDPFFAILEMHRVLKFNGTLFLSTPNLGSFASLARLQDGWSPYAFSKFLSNTEGEGNVTHIREYTWRELDRYMEVAGFEAELRCFSTYAGDKDCWDFAKQQPKPPYMPLLQALPPEHRTLDLLGSTAFIIARKTSKPHERRPWQLYAYGREFKFTDYPVCKSPKHEQLCRSSVTDSAQGISQGSKEDGIANGASLPAENTANSQPKVTAATAKSAEPKPPHVTSSG